jgi:hypothetical protein
LIKSRFRIMHITEVDQGFHGVLRRVIGSRR